MDELIERLDKSLHRLYQAMYLDRLPIRREYGSFSSKNLSIMEIRILCIIDENDEIPLLEIRDSFDLPNSTLTSIIKKFEVKKLICRLPNPQDGRSYLLKITPKGRQINQEHRGFDRLIAINFLDRLGDDKAAETFIEVVEKTTRTLLLSMEDLLHK